MGVDLGGLVARRTTSLEALSGKSLAVDAFNTIYQFLASIRQEDGTPLMDSQGRITSHLSGLFFRNARLMENGTRLIYVFDGRPPRFKKGVHEERARTKMEAERKWQEALEAGRYDEAKKFAQATSRLTHEMIEESRELLAALGIPSVQAPSEGEAQAAAMVRDGDAYASASQDYDSLLFGSPLLVRNINIVGKRRIPRQERYVVVEPEEINLQETLDALSVTREKLVMVGLLTGTDFNEGVHKVGPKTALKIVKGIENLGGLKGYVKARYDYEFEDYIDEVYDFFISPPCEKVTGLRFGGVDREAVLGILVEEHDFSRERVENVLEELEEAHREKGAQAKLGRWL